MLDIETKLGDIHFSQNVVNIPALYCSSPNMETQDSRTPRRLSSYRAKKNYSATGLYLHSNMKRTEPSK